MSDRNFCLTGLLVGVIFLTGVQRAQAESIRMGCFEIPPHIYSSSTGLPAGAAVNFFKIVAKKMGWDIVWLDPLPPARLIEYLKDGKEIDGAPIIARTFEREKFLHYPKNHFYLAKPNFVVRKNNPLIRIDSAKDVGGYVVGQFSRAAYSKFVIENKALFKFDIISPGKCLVEQHLNKLILGRIDAVHTLDEFSLSFEAKRLGMDAKIKVLLLPEPPHPFYSVFCKNEKGKKLARQYDIAIKELEFTSDDYIEFIQAEFALLDKN
ncbi:substrate-binding periplasmic protein [Desulfospira joergensenii]|uniref:substrate-binding periplasmic protein n=1 Tax=Desulfospira joergensenii TaxID=53329 RepID=UPI000A052F3C|nr:transporter substrate-binding domain-containing protein [Desulfospira joergensenii]